MSNRARPLALALALALFGGVAHAQEITVQNDSVTDFSNAAIQAGFVANEKAAAWLDSPCDGTIVGAQVFWRSLNGGAAQVVQTAIEIFDGGDNFPIPGELLETIPGPLLSDGVINEFRFLDDQMAVPLLVPVTAGQRFVVSLTFAETPPSVGPSVVTDLDGCQAGRNGILVVPGDIWFSSCALGVTGDFVIRAVVDCPANTGTTDLSIVKTADSPTYTPGMDLGYTIVATNLGPSPANAATVIDFFPTEITGVQWSCSGQGGAACPAPSGSGNLTQSVNLPVGGSLTYNAVGTVDAGAVDPIMNTAQLITPAGLTDTMPDNNTSVAIVSAGVAEEIVFEDSFELQGLRVVPAAVRGTVR